MGRRTAGEPERGRRPRRLRRTVGGRLFDLDERRAVALEELIDDVRAGRPFRAYRRHTGEECTDEVLVHLLRTALPGCAGWVDLSRLSPLPALLAKAETSGEAEHQP
jgi:hypothetical protein